MYYVFIIFQFAARVRKCISYDLKIFKFTDICFMVQNIIDIVTCLCALEKSVICSLHGCQSL